MSFLEQLKKSPYYDKVPISVKEIKSKLAFELMDQGKKERLLKNVENHVLMALMGAIMGGGMVLQWPLGRLSDMMDRRWVMGACAAIAAVAAVVTFDDKQNQIHQGAKQQA